MFSTLIPGVLFALLIILQTPIMVSTLPTNSTTTMITSARLKTTHASDSNRNSNNYSHGNGNDDNLVPPDNTTTLKFTPSSYQSIMSSTRGLAIQAMLSQLDEHDNSENLERGSNDMRIGEILAIVIAALTLLVGIIPLLRCSQFRHWVPFSFPPSVKKALGIKLPNSTPTASEGLAPIPHPLHIHNNHSDSRSVSATSDTFLSSRDGITEEDDRAPQAREPLALRRPERTVTCPLP